MRTIPHIMSRMSKPFNFFASSSLLRRASPSLQNEEIRKMEPKSNSITISTICEDTAGRDIFYFPQENMMTEDKIIMNTTEWTEFFIPDSSSKSISCSISDSRGCLMRIEEGPFSNYTLAVDKNPPQLINNQTGKKFDLPALSQDRRRYAIKSSDGQRQLSFDIDNADSSSITSVTLLDGKSSHRFNFYKNHKAITVDKEYVPSILKVPTKLRLGKSHGYGVFATADIKKGEIVEETPMLSQLDPYLTDYTFGFNRQHLLALGFGSLYNHSDDPNIGHSISPQGNIITFTALRDIPEGSQCTISYGKNYFLSRGIIPDVL